MVTTRNGGFAPGLVVTRREPQPEADTAPGAVTRADPLATTTAQKSETHQRTQATRVGSNVDDRGPSMGTSVTPRTDLGNTGGMQTSPPKVRQSIQTVDRRARST